MLHMQTEFSCDENEEVEFEKYHKVRDHCHYTGKFRGTAHSICNLTYKIPKTIPLIIHNGSTYDYHFIVKQLSEGLKVNFWKYRKICYFFSAN